MPTNGSGEQLLLRPSSSSSFPFNLQYRPKVNQTQIGCERAECVDAIAVERGGLKGVDESCAAVL